MAIANTGSRRQRGIPSCGDLVYSFGVSCARGTHTSEDHLKCRWLSECKLIETNWLVQMPQIQRVIYLLDNENKYTSRVGNTKSWYFNEPRKMCYKQWNVIKAHLWFLLVFISRSADTWRLKGFFSFTGLQVWSQDFFRPSTARINLWLTDQVIQSKQKKDEVSGEVIFEH